MIGKTGIATSTSTMQNEHRIPGELLNKKVRVTGVGCGGTGSAVAAGLQEGLLDLLRRGQRGVGLSSVDCNVVVNSEFSQSRKHANQVQDTAGVPFTYFSLWNVVPSASDSGAYPGNVEFWSSETYIPDPNLNSARQSSVEQR
jgi:hypothetical protein